MDAPKLLRREADQMQRPAHCVRATAVGANTDTAWTAEHPMKAGPFIDKRSLRDGLGLGRPLHSRPLQLPNHKETY